MRMMCILFYNQKTAYEMRISDWSSDVCSSDLKLYLTMRAEASAGQSIPVTTRHLESLVRLAQVRICTMHDVEQASSVITYLIAYLWQARAKLELREHRSAERRVGRECVRSCRYRWSRYP